MKTYLESKEVDRIEQATECLRDKLLVRLLARLGCRVSEALGITVSDVDFDQSTVTIVHLKRRIKLSCPKCRARLSRTARFCPGCGSMVEQAVISERVLSISEMGFFLNRRLCDSQAGLTSSLRL